MNLDVEDKSGGSKKESRESQLSVPTPTTDPKQPLSRSNSNMEEKTIEMNVLIKFIKPFDGNREKLNPFINNCKSAYELATKAQKPTLLKYMQSQLESTAESACAIKEFDKFEQFIDFLKQQFGERKHYSHLLSELQGSKQENGESVTKFALRIERCLAKIQTEISVSIPSKKKTEVAGRIAAMEDLALHTFVTGLHPRLSQVVRCRDPDTLNEAIGFAVAEERIVAGIQVKRPFVPRRDYQPPHPSFPVNQKNTNSAPNTSNSGPSNGPVICRYCKNPGHVIADCKKRDYNNKIRNEMQQSSPQFQGRNNVPNFFRNQPNYNPRRVFNVQNTDEGVDEVDRSLNG